MKFSRFDPPYESYPQWISLCPEGTWKKVEPDLLNGLIPPGLLNKTNSVFVMASGSQQASAFLVNHNRVDEPARAVDQEPYIAVFNHDTLTASGGFVNHGNWPGRTTKPGNDFFNTITASGIQAYYPLKEMPTASSGNIEELRVDSQKHAFWNAVSLMNGGTEKPGTFPQKIKVKIGIRTLA